MTNSPLAIVAFSGLAVIGVDLIAIAYWGLDSDKPPLWYGIQLVILAVAVATLLALVNVRGGKARLIRAAGYSIGAYHALAGVVAFGVTINQIFLFGIPRPRFLAPMLMVQSLSVLVGSIIIIVAIQSEQRAARDEA